MIARMPIFAAAIAALVLAVAAPAAGDKTFEVKGNTAGDDYFFEVDGLDGRNPTLNVEAGEKVTVNFETVDDQVHNFQIDGIQGATTEIVGSAEGVQTVTFTIPASAAGKTLEYYCLPHKGLGMKGEMKVAGGAAPETPKNSPGFEGALALAAVGLALVAFTARRRA